jgi:hypothetical protein
MCSSLLDMALLIAISNGAEGEEARILFKKAQVLQLMSSTSDTAEIADLRGRARNLKEKVEENLGLPQRTDPNNTANEEEQYNKLVAIFHW